MTSAGVVCPVKKKILLTGVFGPFGVDDEFGRKENIMELFHNQVTKAQGAASFRFHHRSFGLYFIAANLDADVTVLDFPSRERFVEEVCRGYDLVGISFITPNFAKAREMARLTRAYAPEAEIVIGGHGAAIEGVGDLIDCDHVVKGEGIRWMRRHLGQDPDAPIEHPSLPTTEFQRVLGLPVPGQTSSVLVPGVGCVNGCSFCCTSHFFGLEYTSYVSSGRRLFELATRIADERGSDVFFVMDENFLKDKQRALEFIDQMDRHQRFFSFYLFSSAETIIDFGIDNLVRLGVTFLWVGFESKTRQSEFAKNDGIDARALVQTLRDHGISVLASGILCMEHHTPDNMQEDIDYLVGLEADLVQFMLLMPLPVTATYLRFKRLGMLKSEIPFEEWHGQKSLPWRHPAFPGDEAEKWLGAAFDQDYRENSSSFYRFCRTALRGYETLASTDERDANLEARMQQMADRAREYGLALAVVNDSPVNDLERKRVRALLRDMRELLGPLTLGEKLKQAAAHVLAAAWRVRLRLFGDEIQPKTIVTRYPAESWDEIRERGLQKLRELEAAAVESLDTRKAALVRHEP
jgi:hypothetical protein